MIRALYNLFQSFHQVDRQRKEQKGNGTDKADSPSEGTKVRGQGL